MLLTHGTAARANYYGARALAGLQAIAEVVLNPGDAPLLGDALVEAARGCQVIVSDRQAAAPAALFERLPELAVFERCAVDVRNVDVAAASATMIITKGARALFKWVCMSVVERRNSRRGIAPPADEGC